jgi:hypothetical protein
MIRCVILILVSMNGNITTLDTLFIVYNNHSFAKKGTTRRVHTLGYNVVIGKELQFV